MCLLSAIEFFLFLFPPPFPSLIQKKGKYFLCSNLAMVCHHRACKPLGTPDKGTTREGIVPEGETSQCKTIESDKAMTLPSLCLCLYAL